MRVENVTEYCGLDYFANVPGVSKAVASVLIALTHQVKLFTTQLVAALLWPHSPHAEVQARRLLRRLVERGDLARYEVLAPPLPDVSRPLFSWAPGREPPDCDALSYAARSRWTSPPRTIAVFVATKKATRFYGGSPGHVDSIEIAHDLITSTVFVQQDEATRRDWVGEAVYAAERIDEDGRLLKCPDALLVRDGEVYHCVESIGAYNATHLRSFFYDFALPESISFDMW